jgi:hypothetical protein
MLVVDWVRKLRLAWILPILVSFALLVYGQAPNGNQKTDPAESMANKIKLLEFKVADLEKRVKTLENPSPKMVPIHK